MRSGIPVECDLLGDAPLCDCLLQELLRGRDVAMLTQENIKGLSRFVDAPLSIDPVAFAFDRGLVATPGHAYRPRI